MLGNILGSSILLLVLLQSAVEGLRCYLELFSEKLVFSKCFANIAVVLAFALDNCFQCLSLGQVVKLDTC